MFAISIVIGTIIVILAMVGVVMKKKEKDMSQTGNYKPYWGKILGKSPEVIGKICDYSKIVGYILLTGSIIGVIYTALTN